jgi:large subunit ribosomal protein L15
MRLGEIKCPPGSRRQRKRRGQGTGTGNGKTAGRGHKGQRARSGGRRGSRTGFEGGQMPTYRHVPKIGFNNKNFTVEYQPVNLGAIDERGLEGEVGPEQMQNAGLVKHGDGRVKILGTGELTRGLTIRAHGFSKAAREKIERAGGRAEVI